MEKLLTRLLWAVKQGSKMQQFSKVAEVKDNEHFTKFLKSHPHFVNAAKSFHNWKEQLLKAGDSNKIEDSKAKRGP